MKLRLMWILWPAFLAAGLMEMLVFGLVDPQDIQWLGQFENVVSRKTFYALSFFAFWGITTMSSAMTCLLANSPFEKNRCTMDPNDRPHGCNKRPIQ
jgi:hypothetical protein